MKRLLCVRDGGGGGGGEVFMYMCVFTTSSMPGLCSIMKIILYNVSYITNNENITNHLVNSIDFFIQLRIHLSYIRLTLQDNINILSCIICPVRHVFEITWFVMKCYKLLNCKCIFKGKCFYKWD